MKIRLVAYGIAKEILSQATSELVVQDSIRIADLKKILVDRYPAFDKLRSLRFAINEDYQEDNYELSADDEVVIIPPVSGG